LARAVADAARAATTQQTPEASINTFTALLLLNGPWDAASVTILNHGGSPTTIATTCQLALQADRLQLKVCEGPFPDAMVGEPVVFAENLQREQRWPHWTPNAAGLGIVSAAALRLFTDATLGSLNLYSRRIVGNQPGAVEAAGIVAAHVSVFVAHARAERSLGQAIQSRNMIGQAQGMLMQRYGITADSAFRVLRRYSQNLNTKLVVIAERFISTGKLPDLENPPRHSASDPPS
jgi:hypothetical protein